MSYGGRGPSYASRLAQTSNCWIGFVKHVRNENPGISYKEALQIASPLYRKGVKIPPGLRGVECHTGRNGKVEAQFKRIPIHETRMGPRPKPVKRGPNKKKSQALALVPYH